MQQAESDQQHLRAEMQAARNRISLEIHQSYLDIRKADIARELAQADLDLARSQLSIVLAQMGEGRASLRQVEEARFAEDEKWIAFYDAQFNSERARWNVLRETGELRATPAINGWWGRDHRAEQPPVRPRMQQTVYTIGHSSHPQEKLLGIAFNAH